MKNEDIFLIVNLIKGTVVNLACKNKIFLIHLRTNVSSTFKRAKLKGTDKFCFETISVYKYTYRCIFNIYNSNKKNIHEVKACKLCKIHI